ncbi:putative phospholipid-transporting ATPase IH [Brachionus plicatilis]|uniref:Putative phospholipid-transporting ATPase IH n=1 Tax=Brachionus plicatilis TaxID=10195 RepID=A0A3M7RNZ3_BRAPC|nr:putative phospholipid-transporting ATPase IH [Brachionus plicatilis]
MEEKKKTIKRNKLLKWIEFIKWNTLGVWHSAVSFFFAYAILQSETPLGGDGKNAGSAVFGAMIFTQIFIVVHIKLLLEWHYKSYFILVGFGLSLFFYFLFCFILNSFIVPFPLTIITENQTIYWIYNFMYTKGPFWFYIFLSTVVSLIPDIIFKIIENILQMNTVKRLKQEEIEKFEKGKRMEKMEDKETDFKKVRVFYVPPGINRVIDTKVKDESMDSKKKLISSLSQKNDKMFRKSFQLHQRY